MDASGSLVAARCSALLGEPNSWKVPEGYLSLALSVLDSIYSVGIRYERVVVPLLGRYREYRRNQGADPNHDTIDDLLAAVASAGGPFAFADTVVKNHNRTSPRNGILKSEAVVLCSDSLKKREINTRSDLLALDDEALGSVESDWRAVRGQASGITWKYLLLLAGKEQVKPDRMVRRFVAEALGHGPDESKVSAATAEAQVHGALEILRQEQLSLSLRTLDHAIWRYQSYQSRPRRRSR